MKPIKKISQLLIQPIIRKRIHRTSIYTQNGITLHLPPGVFHPAYFFSTQFLLKYIRTIEIRNKQFLELGAGNGLISFVASGLGAQATASDISHTVITALQENAKSNNINIRIIESDLFANIPPQLFDIIAINPPYYPEDPRNAFEQAWYSGKEYQYFTRLFSQLAAYINSNTKVIMVLSEECDLQKIMDIASLYQFSFHQIIKKRIYWEWNYIFEITFQNALNAH